MNHAIRLFAIWLLAFGLCVARGEDWVSNESGSVLDQFHPGDSSGNLLVLKEALDNEVRQRQLTASVAAQLLEATAPWIDRMRALHGDLPSLRRDLHLSSVLTDAQVGVLSRLLNLPPAPLAAPTRETAVSPKASARRLARELAEENAKAFDAFADALLEDDAKKAVVDTAPKRRPEQREWSASGAPRR
jgi:hypothetical protein